MCLIVAHAHLKKENLELKARLALLDANYPPPPSGGVKISSYDLRRLLRQYGIILSGSTSDRATMLMKKEDGQRFLDWYRDIHSYTSDEYDCDKYAWCMRSAAIQWMDGKYCWGYIEAEGADIIYAFPNHGFNFNVFDDKKVYYCDELAVAAPEDEFYEAYKVNCYAAKA